MHHPLVQILNGGCKESSPVTCDLTPIHRQRFDMAVRSERNIEKQKKKKRRVIPRAKVTRNQGNTLGARQRLKKMAGKARTKKAAAAR